MTSAPSFDTATLEQLEAMDSAVTDMLPFGVVGLDPEGLVDVYNATETRLAGLSPEVVMGRHFFHAVAPCMNNFMVAQRFEDEAKLDDTIRYVLTFRMRPRSVRLRLLQQPEHSRRYILIERD